MELTLYHCHEARSMRTIMLLEELGLSYELVVLPFGKALRSPEVLAVSPAGRVPALAIDGRAMIETGAIAEYLTEVDGGALYRGPGDPERAEWLQWIHFAETIGQHIATLTQQHVVLYEDKDRSPLIMKIERRRLEITLGVLEAALEGRDYVLASGFSAADIGLGYDLYVARRFTPLDAMPNLAAYYARIAARPSFQASLPPAGAEGIYRRDFYDLPEGHS